MFMGCPGTSVWCVMSRPRSQLMGRHDIVRCLVSLLVYGQAWYNSLSNSCHTQHGLIRVVLYWAGPCQTVYLDIHTEDQVQELHGANPTQTCHLISFNKGKLLAHCMQCFHSTPSMHDIYIWIFSDVADTKQKWNNGIFTKQGRDKEVLFPFKIVHLFFVLLRTPICI